MSTDPFWLMRLLDQARNLLNNASIGALVPSLPKRGRQLAVGIVVLATVAFGWAASRGSKVVETEPGQITTTTTTTTTTTSSPQERAIATLEDRCGTQLERWSIYQDNVDGPTINTVPSRQKRAMLHALSNLPNEPCPLFAQQLKFGSGRYRKFGYVGRTGNDPSAGVVFGIGNEAAAVPADATEVFFDAIRSTNPEDGPLVGVANRFAEGRDGQRYLEKIELQFQSRCATIKRIDGAFAIDTWVPGLCPFRVS